MCWTGVSLDGWIPENGRRVRVKWLDNDESWLGNYEDLYGDW